MPWRLFLSDRRVSERGTADHLVVATCGLTCLMEELKQTIFTAVSSIIPVKKKHKNYTEEAAILKAGDLGNLLHLCINPTLSA